MKEASEGCPGTGRCGVDEADEAWYTRCTVNISSLQLGAALMTHPSGDWSVFQQIFADHWDEFQRAHPRYQTSYYDGLVAKMLACGNPDKMGYVEYRCLQCGQGTHRVAMSCKSSLCLRCAKVYVDNWPRRANTAEECGE